MAVIADGDHAVNATVACGCQKATSGSEPNISYFIFVFYASSTQVCVWSDEQARDDFYKKLVDALGT